MATAQQKDTKTVVIKVGETLVLPKGASILSVGKNGSVQATSNCGDVQDVLDNAETYACYSFGLGCDDDANTSHMMDEEGAKIHKIMVGGEIYDFTAVDGGIVIDSLEIPDYGKDLINNKIPKELLEVYEIVFQQFAKREEYTIKVRMLPSIAAKAEFLVGGQGFSNGLYLKPVKITCPT